MPASTRPPTGSRRRGWPSCRNGAPLGGLKVTTENAWFAARPSGTEDVYKIYAESFKGPEHLAEVQEAAKEVVNKVIA